MSLTATHPVRWLRAGVVTAIALGFGTAAHSFAGGLLPTFPVFVFLGAVMLPVAAAALGRPADYGRILALVAGGQMVVHLALTATAGHGGANHHHPAASQPGSATPAAATDAMNAPASPRGALDQLAVSPDLAAPHDHATTTTSQALAKTVEHLLAELSGPQLLMTFAHLGAAALVALWLFAGERALWTLIALLGRHLVDRLRALATLAFLPRRAVPVAPLSAGVARADSPRLRAARNGPTGRRGPPLRGACFSTLRA